MAVSKRTRYEVLRRDGNRCRYCGGQAPDVTLTVDHVVPVALGGSDDPGNLVAACRDCNAGKSSSSPEASVVADVAAESFRWAEALRITMRQAEDDLAERSRYRSQFIEAWEYYDSKLVFLPSSWTSSLNHWHALGVPVGLVTEAVDIAFGQERVPNRDLFRYMAGVIWRRLDDIRAKAEEASTSSPSRGCGHCIVCRSGDVSDGEPCELENMGDPACRHCGNLRCPYEVGFSEGSMDGYSQGWDRMKEEYQYRDAGTRLLEMVVDGR